MGKIAYIYFMPVCPMVFLFKIHSLKEIHLLEEKKKKGSAYWFLWGGKRKTLTGKEDKGTLWSAENTLHLDLKVTAGCVCIYICVYIYVCVCVYIYIYTYIYVKLP